MTNYVEVLGSNYPDARVHVEETGSIFEYDDLIWHTPPIAKSVLDQASIETNNITQRAAEFIGIQQATVGDSLVWNGTQFVISRSASRVIQFTDQKTVVVPYIENIVGCQVFFKNTITEKHSSLLGEFKHGFSLLGSKRNAATEVYINTSVGTFENRYEPEKKRFVFKFSTIKTGYIIIT